jgi:hypothetical protein
MMPLVRKRPTKFRPQLVYGRATLNMEMSRHPECLGGGRGPLDGSVPRQLRGASWSLGSKGVLLLWKCCEGLKARRSWLVQLADENGQFLQCDGPRLLGGTDSEGARQTVCWQTRLRALATCRAVRVAARAKIVTRELAPGDVPLIVEREPRSSVASSRYRRKLYFLVSSLRSAASLSSWFARLAKLRAIFFSRTARCSVVSACRASDLYWSAYFWHCAAVSIFTPLQGEPRVGRTQSPGYHAIVFAWRCN